MSDRIGREIQMSIVFGLLTIVQAYRIYKVVIDTQMTYFDSYTATLLIEISVLLLYGCLCYFFYKRRRSKNG